jgi:hypothetical protein
MSNKVSFEIEKTTLLGQGRHRKTYLSPSGKFVVKIPHGEWCGDDGLDGQLANIREAEIFKKTKGKDGEFRYARCRLMANGWLVMEKIDNNYRWGEMPSWVLSIDCAQVGKNRKGDWVAYDYAG